MTDKEVIEIINSWIELRNKLQKLYAHTETLIRICKEQQKELKRLEKEISNGKRTHPKI